MLKRSPRILAVGVVIGVLFSCMFFNHDRKAEIKLAVTGQFANKTTTTTTTTTPAPTTTTTKRLIESNAKPIDNFDKFPCLDKLPAKPRSKCVRTICKAIGCANRSICAAVQTLKYVNNVTICTYDPNIDVIAHFIKKDGGWEYGPVNAMVAILQENPEMMLVDIGCNVGSYTIAAAFLGRAVICIDANPLNIRMVYTSLMLGNLTENVTLVWNALSSAVGYTNLKVNKVNVGASRVGYPDDGDAVIKSAIITMDQLVPLVKGKKVFMKMDIEGYEMNALAGGREFMKNADVRYLQLEYHTIDIREKLNVFLREFDMLLFRTAKGKNRTSKQDIETLGKMEDAYFIKTTQLI